MIWIALQLYDLVCILEIIEANAASGWYALGFGFENTVLIFTLIYPHI